MADQPTREPPRVDDNLGPRLDAILLAPEAERDLRRYFGRDGSPPHTGASFERLAGGGDRAEVRDVITGDDIVAVTLLGHVIPGRVVLKLHGRPEISELLRRIPTSIPLWEAGRDLVAGPVWELWDLVCGWGRRTDAAYRWVTANKLLARKRPHLYAVYDRVVRDVVALTPGAGWWPSLQAALQDANRRQQIETLRSAADIGEDISLLRTLIITVWMHGKRHLVPPSKEEDRLKLAYLRAATGGVPWPGGQAERLGTAAPPASRPHPHLC